MSDAKNKVDELLRKEDHKRFRLYSLIFAFLVVSTVGVVAYSTGETTSVEAKVTAFYSQASEELGERFYIIVKLEIPRETLVKNGDSVILNERKTNLFKLTNYSFQRVAS